MKPCQTILTTGVLLGAFFMPGCGLTPVTEQARMSVATVGAAAYDAGLENAEWFVCRAASVGSVVRRYGKSEDLAEAWRTLCLGDQAPVLVPPLPQ